MKTSKYFWLIVVASCLPFLAYFLNPLMPHTHDGPVHLARIVAWFKALNDGQLPPRWAADLNYGYGTPVLIFMYPWPYFLSAVFLKFGFSLVFTFKLMIFLSFLSSGVLMFIFANSFCQNETKAFLVTILYQFASFRLIEMMIRGALGEVWTYAFLPLALLGLVMIANKKHLTGIILAALGTGLLVLSHNSVSLSFFGVLILFILIFGKSLVDRFWAFLSLLWGLGLASFYWLPALLERQYTYGDLFMRNLYLEHFPTLKQLFLPNFLNQDWGQVHDIATQIGLIPLLLIIGAIFLLSQRQTEIFDKKISFFVLTIMIFALVLMQSISIPLWEKFSLLRQFQFSWRLLSLVVLATSLAGISLFSFTKNQKVIFLVVGLVFFLSVPFWRTLGYDKINEEDYWHYPLNTTYFGEADTIWAAAPPDAYPDARVTIIEGQGKINNFWSSSTEQRFLAEAQTEVNLLSRMIYFPGWRVMVDGQAVPVEFQDQNARGLITFRLPAGTHQIKVKFTRTKDRKISELISLMSFILLGFLLITALVRRHQKAIRLSG
jgi:hypothetical protein